MPKRRPPAAAVDAFAAGVENTTPEASAAAPADSSQPPTDTAAPLRARPQRTARPATSTAGERWPEGLATSLLLRYREPSLPLMLAQIAEREDRSQQQMAHRALKLGLEQMMREDG